MKSVGNTPDEMKTLVKANLSADPAQASRAINRDLLNHISCYPETYFSRKVRTKRVLKKIDFNDMDLQELYRRLGEANSFVQSNSFHI